MEKLAGDLLFGLLKFVKLSILPTLGDKKVKDSNASVNHMNKFGFDKVHLEQIRRTPYHVTSQSFFLPQKLSYYKSFFHHRFIFFEVPM